MSQDSSVLPDGVSISFWKAHQVEIFWAFVFAIAVAALIEIPRRLWNFRKLLKKRNSSLRLYVVEVWERKFAKDRSKPLNNREIERSIETNIDNLDKASVVFAIGKKGALTNKDNSHYQADNYHFARFLRVLPVLDGDERFFIEACRNIGEMLRNSEIDCLLCLDKDSDYIFCNEVLRQSLPERVKVHRLGYSNHTEDPKVIYRENESLEGQNVAILTALTISEKPLVDFAEFVRSQGANLVGVAILFDALSGIVDIVEAIQVPVTSAIAIDLKHCLADQCTWCPTKTNIKKIWFNDY